MPAQLISDAALLRSGVDRLGPNAARALLKATAGRGLSAIDRACCVDAGLSPKLTERVLSLVTDPSALKRVSREVSEGLGPGDQLLTVQQTAGLPGLSDLKDPPLVLAASAGFHPSLLRRRRVAIVGTRDPTSYGRDFARALAGNLARHQVVIVSGGAEGIDSESHWGALDSAGETLAVLGAALHIERQRNLPCYERLFADAAVVSEQLLPQHPAKWMYPRRNRLVAALAEAVVVVEGAARSGALITAELAREIGRPVLAVPGRLIDPMSEAPNALLATGALACRGAGDVFKILGSSVGGDRVQAELALPEAADLQLGVDEVPLVKLLRAAGEGLHVDELAARLGSEPAALAELLLRLELKGVLRRGPGQLVELVPTSSAPPSKG